MKIVLLFTLLSNAGIVLCSKMMSWSSFIPKKALSLSGGNGGREEGNRKKGWVEGKEGVRMVIRGKGKRYRRG